MDEGGYIKLYRKILKWEWWEEPGTFRVFVYLLLQANHTDGNWKGIAVGRGQHITSVAKICEATSLTTKVVRTSMQRLKRTNELAIEATKLYTLVTICKYEDYQGFDKPKGKPKGKAVINNGANEGQLTIIKEVDTNVSTWRNDFKVYLTECNAAYQKYYSDNEFLKEQQYFNPTLNIQKTIMKGYKQFWGLEAGWKHKKASRTVTLDWRTTIISSLSIASNKVYLTKEELNNQ